MITATESPIDAFDPVDAAGSADPDLSLLHRYIATGDPAAFAAIVDRYGRVVYAASMRILGDQGGAQDVSQETFFRLMRQPRSVNQSLAGWLHRTASRVALDVRRSEKARHDREARYGLLRGQQSAEEPTWAQLSPMVDQAMDELDEPTRTLLVRHFLQGTPQADLAAELGLSASTVCRRIKSALANLQTELSRRGVRLGAATLAVFFLHCAARPAPAAFVAEMAKMHLIASVRASVVNPPAPPLPAPLAPRRAADAAAAKFTAAEALIMAVCLAFMIAVSISWFHARSGSPSAPTNVSAADDR
jgi:RNA polymerase sigma-70 factor (ECF subfamily)